MQYNKFIEEILHIKALIEKDKQFVIDKSSFAKAFLWDCSSTPANLEALEHIEYNSFFDQATNKECYGLKVKNKELSISEIFFKSVECNDQVINNILELYPQLTIEEVESVLRFITVILTDLEYMN